jgi:adenine-specific DNA-methyltransferase
MGAWEHGSQGAWEQTDSPQLPGPLAPQLTTPVTPADYATHTPLAHRRRWGQFFTPALVARWMADWTLQPHTRSILDPAAGTGTLIEALVSHPRCDPMTHGVAYEADPRIVEALRHNLDHWSATHVEVRLRDFLLDPDDSRFDAIVCNPPYLRHRQLANRPELYRACESRWQVQLSAFSNSYALFILAIAGRLSERGRAAILTPADYLNANFGASVREALLRANLIDGIILFDHARLLFADANIAASLLLLRAGRAADEPIRFVHLADESELDQLPSLPPASTTLLAPSSLTHGEKWLPRFRQLVAAPAFIPGRRMTQLGMIADVRRGIATGANDYFTLSQAEREQYGIDLPHVRPCVTRAPHAPYYRFTADDLDRLMAAGRKVWLLDTNDSSDPAVQRYLAEGRRRGIDQRFLPSHRNPWHAAEPKPVAPLWINAFSRNGFRCVLNDAGVAQLTAFHGIYPRAMSHDDLLILAAFLNSGHGAAAITRERRALGSGLAKLEPGDVAALHVPDPELIHESLRRSIIDLHESRCRAERADSQEARRIADEIDRLWAAYPDH